MNRTLLGFSLLLPLYCIAGSNDYECKVMQELTISDDGQLVPHKNPIEIGNTFTVIRETGKITGRPFNNSTARKVEVITQGDKSRNFEVISASSQTAKATTDFIVIQEWAKNLEKPFIGLSSTEVFSGTCK